MSDDTLGVGIVGLGRVSALHFAGFGAVDNAQVRAVCDADGDLVAAAVEQHRLEHAFATTEYDEVLAREDVHAVSLAVPDYLHHPMTLRAVQAGKHVLCEKPVALNAEQAEEMLAAAEDAGVAGAVHLQRRNEPPVRFIRELVAEGRLGEVRHFRCRMSVNRLADPTVPLEWRFQADKSCYGVLGDLGAHALDLARFTMGDAADRVEDAAAMGAIFIPVRRLQDGSGTGQVTALDAINVCLRYGDGALGQLQLSRFSPGFFAFEIDGQEGSARLSPTTPEGCIELYEREPRDDQVPASEYVAVEVPERHEQGPTVFAQFVDAALTGGEATPGFRDGVVIARQLDRIHEAGVIGRAD